MVIQPSRIATLVSNLSLNRLSQLDCRGKLVSLTTPQVVGIINVSPDSFSAVGRCHHLSDILQRAQDMQDSGVAIIDVGGEATNPQLSPVVSQEIELSRVVPVVTALAKHCSIPISVDTSKPAVMQAVVDAGASMINDVRALRLDGAVAMAAKLNVPVCLMHMAFPDGVPSRQINSSSQDIVTQVKQFLLQRMRICLNAGIKKQHIILDPGIGAGNFGKSTTESCRLLAAMPQFVELGQPVLVGVSRKTFIGDILKQDPSQRLFGSIAAATIAMREGASFIRCHDYRETIDALKIVQQLAREDKEIE